MHIYLDQVFLPHAADVQGVYDDAEKFLSHHCNPLFLDCVRPSEYRCCKLNKLRVILDNTKHTFKHEGADPIISANLYLAVFQAVLPLGK